MQIQIKQYSVVGATPKVWLIIFVKCKISLNTRIVVLQCILYQYIETFVFLVVARRGLSSPLNQPLGGHFNLVDKRIL